MTIPKSLQRLFICKCGCAAIIRKGSKGIMATCPNLECIYEPDMTRFYPNRKELKKYWDKRNK